MAILQFIETQAQVVMAGAAVVGFMSISRQLKQVDAGLRGDAKTSIFDMAATVKITLLKHPEVRYFLFRDAKPDDENLQQRLEVMVDLYCLYLERIAVEQDLIREENRHAWLSYVRKIYDDSPPIRAYLHANEKLYSRALWRVIRAERDMQVAEFNPKSLQNPQIHQPENVPMAQRDPLRVAAQRAD